MTSKLYKAIGVLILFSMVLTAGKGQHNAEKQGREIRSVVIGTQEWSATNLGVTHFRNGDPIFEANSYEAWEEACIKGLAAWCYYDNNPDNGRKYGKLYNYWAVSDKRGLAPEGWHIPDNKEWDVLAESLGGIGVAGKVMKSNNMRTVKDRVSDGFLALTGGYRTHEMPGFKWGPFYHMGEETYWWSVTRYLVDNVWAYKISEQSDELGKGSFVRTAGLYVRLVKD